MGVIRLPFLLRVSILNNGRVEWIRAELDTWELEFDSESEKENFSKSHLEDYKSLRSGFAGFLLEIVVSQVGPQVLACSELFSNPH